MVQRSNYALLTDEQTKSSKEECAFDMGLRANDAAAKGAQIMS